ncbi:MULTISPECIES: GlsB/YeaQ/YmgE family stress response membrane protein [unclassified Lysobacter]|uniref:GlsB/YeaQ/YmgE family stress response membrane protein n=1 Tax=unclassified Lysobacter TaxID=2635362 RepID=UPI001C244916|nr:GlsB/YeaQ/YmgE family stress response membrane protein [Lysobacter sp. MMG2]MBU8977021.1 GlsB/YeaQ/YmgE family stress response membrane protein [Lysobacter sp. MMG2]
MGILIWLIVGGVIGWIASLVMRTDAQQGLFLNIIVGIVGAFIGGWLGGMFGLGGDINSGDFSLSGLLMSLVGAIVLLAIVNLFRRGRVR